MKLVYINVTNSLNHKKMDNSSIVDSIIEHIAEKMIGVDPNSMYIEDTFADVDSANNTVCRSITISVPDNIEITQELIDRINNHFAENTTHTVLAGV